MILEKLEEIVRDGKVGRLSGEIIKIQLKEFMILACLDFIYNSPRWSNLIFTGGTALRVLGETARLSEDLDLDNLEREFDSQAFSVDLLERFQKMGFPDAELSIKSNGKVITLKFPILEKLGLCDNKAQTNFLHLKIEVENNHYEHFATQKTAIMKNNLFFVVESYDFPTLFAGKIGAILGRKGKIFLNQYDFRGRDFYDLIWFLEKGYWPNLARVKEIIKTEQGIEIGGYADLWHLLSERVSGVATQGIYADLKNLTLSPEATKKLADNYQEIFKGLLKKYLI
ncbi:MAG: nucleotidyl transferase AbiEii/AbiGii toxin family protein [Candidatus Moraniibacteriota bacterium]|jgi:predicted nucleotidyltransferase component of viral defense system